MGYEVKYYASFEKTLVMDRLIFLLFFLLLSVASFPQEGISVDSTLSGYQLELKLGNPTNKSIEIAEQDIAAPYYRFDVVKTKSWFDFKKRLNENSGIQISTNYTSAFMGASSTIEEGSVLNAASGIWDFTIKWDFINRKKGKNKGTLVYWIDSRHSYYNDFPAQNLYQETGSGLINALKFGQWSLRTLEFYYQQSILNDRAAVIVGKIDMADWFTYNGLLHPMMHFTDFAFSVNPTVSWSNTGLGVVVGGWLDKKKRFGLVAGFNDVAGDNISENNFLDMGAKNWDDGKFLKMAEFNFSPNSNLYYFNRLSFTVWHSDETSADENDWYTSPSNTGFSVQGTWFINNKHIPVFTIGMSDGDAANRLSRLNISAMYGRVFKNHDMFAVGINYTESAISKSAQGLCEVFYRYTLSKALTFTPVVKGVINPALDANRDFLFYYGMRSRISF